MPLCCGNACSIGDRVFTPRRVPAAPDAERRLLLPSSWRLKRRSRFAAVYSRGRSCATDLVVVYARPNPGRPTRVGFSVGGKLGKAVKRNRIKRLLREAVRTQIGRLKAGFEIVVIARSRAARAGLDDLAGDLAYLFRKSGVARNGDGS